MNTAQGGEEGAFEGHRKSSIVIKGKVLTTIERDIPHGQLKYYADNPRVYSLVRAEKDDPTQEEIEEKLQDSEHVRELVQDLRRNGGLIDPLVVKDGTLEVIEGNSRLAAWRVLAKQSPLKWTDLKCTLLPKEISESEVSALLGQWHLKGKKEWPPYEQAGYLWRRHTEDGIAFPELADLVGLGKTKVKQLAEAYDFMAKNGDVKRDRFSYYFEYTRSSKIARARKKFDKLDGVVVGQIKSGQIVRAQDLRDMLPVICNKEKVLRTFIQDDIPLSDAHRRAEKAGGGHKPSQKLKAFRNWIAKPEVQSLLAAADGSIRQEIEFEIAKLKGLIERVHKKLTA